MPPKTSKSISGVISFIPLLVLEDNLFLSNIAIFFPNISETIILSSIKSIFLDK